LLITALYYSNQEFNDNVIFLDGNIAINKNGDNIVNQVFATPGEILYVPPNQAGKIYQEDSLFVQATANTTQFPEPIFGTSTRTLYVYDSANNTIINSTVNYNSNINTTFSVVGGRTYRAYASTQYTYPTTAVLYIFSLSVVLHNGEYYRTVTGDLSNWVDGSFTIKGGPGFGVSGNLYDTTDCTFGFNTSNFYTAEDFAMNRGFYGFFSMRTDTQYFEGYNSFQFLNYIAIDNGGPNPIGLNNGQTFVVGTTTVTVSIPPDCFAFA
jgi:hypothetical protein